MAEPRLQSIPLSQIQVDPENVRVTYDAHEIEQLRDAFVDAQTRREQFINPPTVYSVGKNKYRVKFGNKRTMAAQAALGDSGELLVLVADPPSDNATKLLDQLSENLLQGGLNEVDQALAIKRLRDTRSPQLSLNDVAQLAGKHGLPYSKAMVQRFVLFADKVNDAVKDMVRRGELPFTHAFELHLLPQKDQVEMAETIKAQRLTTVEARALVAEKLGTTPAPMTSDDEASVAPRTSMFPSTPGSIDTSRVEYGQQQLDARIQELANSQSHPDYPRRAPDAEHRAGRIDRRFELIATPVPEGVVMPDESIRSAAKWFNDASTEARDLVLDLMWNLKVPVPDAIELVQQAGVEAAAAPPSLMGAVNQLSAVLTRPELAANCRAILRLLRLRLDRLEEGATAA